MRVDGTEPPTGFRCSGCGWLGGFGGQRLGFEFGQGGGTAVEAWQLDAMTPDGTGGIWALAQAGLGGKERIWHLRGTTWSLVSPALGTRRWVLEGLALVPRTHSVWAVGVAQAGKSGADGLIAVDGPLPR